MLAGIGSQEDSFGSVLYLQPKPPAKDVLKMLQARALSTHIYIIYYLLLLL